MNRTQMMIWVFSTNNFCITFPILHCLVEAFQKEVEAQRLLKENNRADFVLLRVVMQETDYGKISDALLHVTRKNDILGLGEDGKVYILLSQADRNNLEAIENRMKKNGVEVEIAEKY